MQVGDLVRHEMYSELKTPAIVLAIAWGAIKIFDPDDGVATWDIDKHYEVISAS